MNRPRPAAASDQSPRSDVRFASLAFAGLLALQWTVALAVAFLFRHRNAVLQVHPFTFNVTINFSDLTDYVAKAKHLHGAFALCDEIPIFNYPAPAAFVYSGLLNLRHPVLAFSLIVTLPTLLLAYALFRSLRRAWGDGLLPWIVVGFAVLCAYPFQYLLWRSNLEGIGWVFLAAGFYFYWTRNDLAAALAWGCAICIKPFPVLFFLLLLRRKKYRETAAGLGFAALLNVVALKALGPTMRGALEGLATGVSFYKARYIQGGHDDEVRFQHSLLDSAKAVLYFVRGPAVFHFPSATLAGLALIYTPIAALLLLATAVWFYRKPGLNQLFAIVLVLMLLAPVSADYTLVAVYLLWAAFFQFLFDDVAHGRAVMSRRVMIAFAAAFSVIFSPQNYLRFYGGIVKTLALCVLFYLAACTPMESSLFGDAARTQPLTEAGG